MATAILSRGAHQELSAFLLGCRAQVVRPLGQFSTEEIVIPEGKFEGQHFRYEVQPWTRLFHEAVDSGPWTRVALTGCVQGGKSLLGFGIPTVRHLFEFGEPVVFGAPTIALGKSKYLKEVLPIILKRKRFRELLPVEGAGSRGGIPDEIVYRNGGRLKFMGAGGDDSAKSSYTARVLVATEIDKMDTAGEVSREASPIRQMEARLASYDEEERRVYLECTVSIAEGAIWQELTQGTNSRILCQCPYCRRWSTPERAQLWGHQEAETIAEAREEACWICPDCGALWDDADRVRMNFGARLVHEGQTIDPEGRVEGQPKPTDTLGFRFNAFNNLFWRTSTLAAAEWRARQAEDEDEAEKEARQFRWVIPYAPPIVDTTPLDPVKLRKRVHRGLPRGLVPDDCEYLTLGLDVGKWVGWWFAAAWRPGPRAHVPEYGTIEVPSHDLPVEAAILAALRDFRDRIEGTGFLLPDGGARIPDQIWVDCRYQPDAVKGFCRESGDRWRPCQGFGTADRHGGQYHQPREIKGAVVWIGQQYHLEWDPEAAVHVVKINADAWKSALHERLSLPIDRGEGVLPVGAMTLYDSADANEHQSLVKHLTSEKQTEEIVPGRGRVVRWVHVRGRNHWLDTGYLATAAAHFCGVRFAKQLPEAPPPAGTIRAIKFPEDYLRG